MKNIYYVVMGLLLSVSGRSLYGAAEPMDVDTSMDIHEAARQGNLSEVRRILEQNQALVNAKNDFGETPLYRVAGQGHLPVVQYLVEHGADVNAKSNNGWTPLCWAAKNGYLPVVQYLVEHGASVNAKNNDGWTPLHEAAQYGHLPVVQHLVEYGADYSVKDKNNKAPVECTHSESVREYLTALPQLCQNFLEAAKIAPLALGTKPHGDVALNAIKPLIADGICINTRNSEGNSALHYAAAHGNYCLALYLLGKPTSKNVHQGLLAENNAHESFLDWALRNNQWVYVKVMLQAAYVPVKAGNGESLPTESINKSRKECIANLEQIFPTKEQKPGQQ